MDRKEATKKTLEIAGFEASEVFSRIGQAKTFLKSQPLFYDKNGLWWIWDKENNSWKIVDEVDILNAIRNNLNIDIINSKSRSEIINSLKQVGRENIPKKIKPTWIQFKDMIVDINTGEEFKSTPEYFITNPIPYALHEDKFEDTPIMDKIFKEWVGEEYVETLYEIIAYCLIPNYPIHRLFCFIGNGMNGKCQKGNDKVLMSNGIWKEIKDIKVNDKILSPQKDGTSKFCKVINTHNRFEKEVYEVREKSRKKRLLYTCAGNHLIPIIRNYTKRTTKDDSTPRIMERKLFEYDAKHISKLNNDKSQICSFTTTPIEYKVKDSNVNPYCLGAWLGDGHFSIKKLRKKQQNKRKYRLDNGEYVLGKQLGFTTMDEEVAQEFYNHYSSDMKGHNKKPNNRASTYRMKINGKFAKELMNLNLDGKGSGNKFIPKECLLSSLKYRFELLAGLIDTDGFVQKKTGAVYYTTKSKCLSEDIKNLVFSLGGYSEIRKVKKKSQSGYEGDYFELSIQFKEYNIPLRIPRKKDRLFNKKHSPRNIAIECIKTKPQQVYGIEIEGDSKWYITNDWMVTHNSCFLRLLIKFIGENNVTSTELDTLLTSRFEVTRLHKKLVCVMGETNFNEINKTSILKKLTGQDVIGFEYKNKNPFEDINYAKILIATNNLPTTTDKTIGFYRRWLIIDFPNQFDEKKDILSEIPEEEYQSLALKCINKLRVLLKTKKFTKDGEIGDRIRRYEEKSDFLQKFLDGFIIIKNESYITKSEFQKKFNEWCVENRHRNLAERTLTQKMREKGYYDSKKYFDWLYDGKGGDARIWQNISWKE